MKSVKYIFCYSEITRFYIIDIYIKVNRVNRKFLCYETVSFFLSVAKELNIVSSI
jgi:hypothetical protein